MTEHSRQGHGQQNVAPRDLVQLMDVTQIRCTPNTGERAGRRHRKAGNHEPGHTGRRQCAAHPLEHFAQRLAGSRARRQIWGRIAQHGGNENQEKRDPCREDPVALTPSDRRDQSG